MTSRAVFITHRCHPGRRDDVYAVWERHLEPAITANPDHLGYHYTFDPSDSDVIRVFQLYRNDLSAAAFLTTPEYAAYLAEVEPLLLGPPEVNIGDQIWAKTQTICNPAE